VWSDDLRQVAKRSRPAEGAESVAC
jgi:hypothetical protein